MQRSSNGPSNVSKPKEYKRGDPKDWTRRDYEALSRRQIENGKRQPLKAKPSPADDDDPRNDYTGDPIKEERSIDETSGLSYRIHSARDDQIRQPFEAAPIWVPRTYASASFGYSQGTPSISLGSGYDGSNAASMPPSSYYNAAPHSYPSYGYDGYGGIGMNYLPTTYGTNLSSSRALGHTPYYEHPGTGYSLLSNPRTDAAYIKSEPDQGGGYGNNADYSRY